MSSTTTAIIVLMLLFTTQVNAAPTATGQSMQQLGGVPYQLYATQAQTSRHQALNCATAVIDALRHRHISCPDMTFHQAYTWWRPKAVPLQPGKTPFPPDGALLLTREHFLLLYEDTNRDGLIDGDDLIIHAYYRPVIVETLTSWRQNSLPYPVYYIPINQSFSCPDADAVKQLPRIRSNPFRTEIKAPSPNLPDKGK